MSTPPDGWLGSSPLRGEYFFEFFPQLFVEGSSPLRGEYLLISSSVVPPIGSSPLRGEYVDAFTPHEIWSGSSPLRGEYWACRWRHTRR